MKTVLFSAFFLIASLCSAQRLPLIAVPESYKLLLTPDLRNNKFAGDETIHVRILKDSSEIILNAVDIDVREVTVSSRSGSQQAQITLDKENQTARLTLAKPIPSGTATLHIGYSGLLNDQMRGFYIGKDDQGRKYAATQLEDTDARRFFPCFDEPAYKATFDVTVIADKDLTVISNGKVVSDAPGPGELKHTVHFATSPRMSSYLVAVIVGHFEYIEGEADGIPIRVWTSPGKKELGQFALAAAKFNLIYYDHYFGIKYPYGKLDLVGLADFSAGAMENTGCITFREILLLLDEKHTTLAFKKTVASVIAHEMAHQWFGDLVTMKWWDNKWLNEGFATWMSSKPVAVWKPEWNVQLDDVASTINSLDLDSLVNTHPIHQPADTPAQMIELDDAITYGKAAAVLRMLEFYIGADSFRTGVNSYLSQHSYGNATASDFWNAQTQSSGKPIDKIMPTWTEQPGPPIVTVEGRCLGTSESLSFQQQRYFYDKAKMDMGSPELWQIPLRVREISTPGSDMPKTELLTSKGENFTLPQCSPSLYINADAKGFYRSGYSSDAIQQFAKLAESNLSSAERIMLLSDIWASIRLNRLPIGAYLNVAQGLQADRNSAVIAEVLTRLTYIHDYLLTDVDREQYEHWVGQLLEPIANDVGWKPRPGESEDKGSLRSQLLLALGDIARDPQAQGLAHEMANEYFADSNSVDHEMAVSALQVAGKNGDRSLYDRVLASLPTAKTPEEYLTRVFTLGEFRNPKLVERTLEYAISAQMRSQDAPYLITQIMRNPDTGRQAWDFVQTHWARIETLGGAFAGGAIIRATSGFCDPRTRDEVQAFFTTHPDPAGERSLQQSIEQINYCVDLRERQSRPLASWLQEHSSGTR